MNEVVRHWQLPDASRVILKTSTNSEDNISLFENLDSRSSVCSKTETQFVHFRYGAPSFYGRDYGSSKPLSESCEFIARSGNIHASTCPDNRPLSISEKIRCLVQQNVIRSQASDLLRISYFHLNFSVLKIDGNLYSPRLWPASSNIINNRHYVFADVLGVSN